MSVSTVSQNIHSTDSHDSSASVTLK